MPRRFSAAIILALSCTLIVAACGGSSKSAPDIVSQFSGDRAFEHVRKIVAIGPRTPGSAGIEQARGYIVRQLQESGWSVRRQEFTDRTPRADVQFVNLIATFGSDAKPRFILGSHYDTKVFDRFTFVGANDGGSGNGVLLEMARVLALWPELARKIELVFFDGEEAYESFTATDGLYGSRFFARQLVQAGLTKQYSGGIIFDMVGDRSLTVTLPPDSPAELARGIFAAAEKLGVRKHFTYASSEILDDHTPLNEAGIPTIDIIDFEFSQWHTAGDTLETISGESLQIVGRTAAEYLVNAHDGWKLR